MGEYNGLAGMVNGTAAEMVLEPEQKPRVITDVPDRGSYNAVIIGGGPAGMTAGVYLARKMVSTLIVSPNLGGQVLWTSNVDNYPGYDIISGYDLAMKFKDQLMENRIDIRIGDSVVAIEQTDRGGIARTERGAEYLFRGLIIATGKRSRKLNVPGENELYGRGVTYCSTCDGPLYRGERVAVIGGGNSGITAANDLSALGCSVSVVEQQPVLQADGVLVEKARASGAVTFYINHQVEEILGKTGVTGVRISDRGTSMATMIEVRGVFIEIGLVPNSTFAEGILELNSRREIIVNCRCETNRPGMYAAGDVTNVPDKQIIIAAGEGAKAALGLHSYLMTH